MFKVSRGSINDRIGQPSLTQATIDQIIALLEQSGTPYWKHNCNRTVWVKKIPKEKNCTNSNTTSCGHCLKHKSILMRMSLLLIILYSRLYLRRSIFFMQQQETLFRMTNKVKNVRITSYCWLLLRKSWLHLKCFILKKWLKLIPLLSSNL